MKEQINTNHLYVVMLVFTIAAAVNVMFIAKNEFFQLSRVQIADDKPRYICIQSFLGDANLERVQWFASVCHSYELNVTWFPNEEALHIEAIVSLLKSFTILGDEVGLSFGQSFFNQMEPRGRLTYIGKCMNTFRNTFGYYPCLVQSYYVIEISTHRI